MIRRGSEEERPTKEYTGDEERRKTSSEMVPGRERTLSEFREENG